MWEKWSTRWQTALVAALFLGSLAALFVSAFSTLALPERELRIRNSLREAGRRMAERAAPIIAGAPRNKTDNRPDWDRRLRDVSRAVLAEFPGVEGGFYVPAGGGTFGGYAFPTSAGEIEAAPRGARRRRWKRPIFACKPRRAWPCRTAIVW